MNTIRPVALLLSIDLTIGGCKNAQPPQSPQTSSSHTPSVNEDEYNRNYQTESGHHHRSKRGEAPSDDWAGYDRSESSDGPYNVAYSPRQNDPQRNSGTGQSTTRHHNSRALTAAPGQFDFYVLNLSWSPEFCHSHPTAAECAQHRSFTLHGLWPQNNDGTYPEDCSDAPGPANPSQYADIYSDASLLQHEWQTHGTCSGLAPDTFLSLARRAEQSINIPAELAHPTQQTSLTPTQLITLFTQSNPSIPASSLAISCGNNYLTAVEVCMDKSLKPEACSAVKTCGATQIRIPAPQ
jgi:ribonuclease T2